MNPDKMSTLTEIRKLVDEQAENEGLWFIAEMATEAYLQKHLRELHDLIERLDQRPVKHEFIYTVPGKKSDPQMCYRLNMPYTPMDRWVRCHLIDGRIVLGDRP